LDLNINKTLCEQGSKQIIRPSINREKKQAKASLWKGAEFHPQKCFSKKEEWK
jgi:hypothetical protein